MNAASFPFVREKLLRPFLSVRITRILSGSRFPGKQTRAPGHRFLWEQKVAKCRSFFGTLARELLSFHILLHACCGEKGEESFLPVHIQKTAPTNSHRVLWSSDTKHFWSRQEDAAFDFSRPRARIASLLGIIPSLFHVLMFSVSVERGLAWRFRNQQKLSPACAAAVVG